MCLLHHVSSYLVVLCVALVFGDYNNMEVYINRNLDSDANMKSTCGHMSSISIIDNYLLVGVYK